jgi:uncharacterized protein (DUF983 family)
MAGTIFDKKVKYCKHCKKDVKHDSAKKSRGLVYHLIALSSMGLLYVVMGFSKWVWTCSQCGQEN